MPSEIRERTRRRRPKLKSKAGTPNMPGSSSLRDYRGDVGSSETRRAHPDRLSRRNARHKGSSDGSLRPSRAASPSARAPTPNTSTSSIGRTGFDVRDDYIAFDFSDDGAQGAGEAANHSPLGKGKGRERSNGEDWNRGNGSKRSASQMEAEADGYANKKQRMDAASRLTPWTKDVDWDGCRNLAEMMHKEVKAFATYISPTPEEHEVRRMVVATITCAIQSFWSDAQVLAFGSFETKLYLPLGDIDLVIHSQTMERHERRQILYTLAHVLRKANITSNVTVVAKAKVPIVKFVTNLGRLSVDISLNQGNGVLAVRVVKRFLHELPALQPLVMVIKLFLSQRSMNEVYTGGLGSYSIVCMAISFLQMHPKIRSGEIDPSQNLGVLVMEFFELYGHYFNYDNTGISIRDGGTYFNKQARGWLDNRQTSLLSIEDPNDISNDISKSSYNITRVRTTLAGAHEILTTAALMRARVLLSKVHGRYTNLRPPGSSDHDYDNPSILGSILGVTQETLNHRRLLRQLFEQGTLQKTLGLAPHQSIPVVADRESTAFHSKPHLEHESTIQSAKAVESAWGEADMDLSEREDELLTERLPSPEAEEESRYSSQISRKRRKLDVNSHPDAIYVADSDEEESVVPRPPRPTASDSGESTLSVRDAQQEARRAYWASKGMSGGGLEDSD